MGSFCEENAATVVRQVVQAIKYLHDKRIAHCDLKPENVLLCDDSLDLKVSPFYFGGFLLSISPRNLMRTIINRFSCKVIDFGMAAVVDFRRYLKTMKGTPYYVAPEVLEGKYRESSDMWSIGIENSRIFLVITWF